MKDKLKDLKEVLDNKLLNLDFTESTFSKGAINFYKTKGNIRFAFGFAYNYYSTSIVLSHFGCAVVFDEIENILSPIFVKHGLVGDSYTKSPTSTLRMDSDNKAINKEKTEISNHDNNKDIENKIIDFVKLECLPFFENFDTLEKLTCFVIDLELDQLNNLLGTGAIFKKMYIMYITNHSHTYSFFQEIYEKIKEGLAEYPDEHIYEVYKNIYQDISDLTKSRDVT